MSQELLGIVIFSGFMVCVVGMLVGNMLVALYRERKLRQDPREAQGQPTDE
jgi:hypothetical protein